MSAEWWRYAEPGDQLTCIAISKCTRSSSKYRSRLTVGKKYTLVKVLDPEYWRYDTVARPPGVKVIPDRGIGDWYRSIYFDFDPPPGRQRHDRIDVYAVQAARKLVPVPSAPTRQVDPIPEPGQRRLKID